jgi:hypothetical protein
MRACLSLIPGGLATGLLLAALSLPLFAQEPGHESAGRAPAMSTASAIPDAPAPQLEPTDAKAEENTAQQGSSNSQLPAQPAQAQESRHQKAAEQLKEEERQRVVGIVPDFGVTYHSDAVSLSAGQKMQLAVRSAVDPFTFVAAFLVAGMNEALDEDSGFGWGAEGFGKRSGAAYLDAFDGDILASGVLPVLFHQDPRYFRLGHGSFHHRLFYAVAASFICKHDNTGRWEPNYSNIGGNLAAGAISNLYYPSGDSGWGRTIGNGMIVTTEGTLGGIFDEFWPDISRKVLHRDPTNGLDAQMRAADQARRQATQHGR